MCEGVGRVAVEVSQENANTCLCVDVFTYVFHMYMYMCVCNSSHTEPCYPTSDLSCSNQHPLSEAQGVPGKAEVAACEGM